MLRLGWVACAAVILASCEVQRTDPLDADTLPLIADQIRSGDVSLCTNDAGHTDLIEIFVERIAEHEPAVWEAWKKFHGSGKRIKFEAVSKAGIDQDIPQLTCSANVKINGHTYGITFDMRPSADDPRMPIVQGHINPDQAEEFVVDLVTHIGVTDELLASGAAPSEAESSAADQILSQNDPDASLTYEEETEPDEINAM